MHIAVLGAGPIGLEAACHATHRGHTVSVFERGQVADAVAQWAHVTMFTPWRMNTSEVGRATLDAAPLPLDDCPTGRDFRERYLLPLAERLQVETHCTVLGVGRKRFGKLDHLGQAERRSSPLVIRCLQGGREFLTEADAVLDCTGVLRQPAPAGRHGMPLPGERALLEASRLTYGLLPPSLKLGARTLVLGDGASASTAVRDAIQQSPDTRIVWCTPSPDGPRFASPEGDPLPERAALHRFAKEVRTHPRVTHRPGAYVTRFSPTDSGVVVHLEGGAQTTVDQVVVCTGYRPDTSLLRELQIHWCWGTEGPMKLAATLLGAQGAAADCLSAPASEAETLGHPEPDVFILGAKSYGRRSDFLLQNGLIQVNQALQLLEKPRLESGPG